MLLPVLSFWVQTHLCNRHHWRQILVDFEKLVLLEAPWLHGLQSVTACKSCSSNGQSSCYRCTGSRYHGNYRDSLWAPVLPLVAFTYITCCLKAASGDQSHPRQREWVAPQRGNGCREGCNNYPVLEPTDATYVWAEIHLGLFSMRLFTVVWGPICLEKSVGRDASG